MRFQNAFRYLWSLWTITPRILRSDRFIWESNVPKFRCWPWSRPLFVDRILRFGRLWWRLVKRALVDADALLDWRMRSLPMLINLSLLWVLRSKCVVVESLVACAQWALQLWVLGSLIARVSRMRSNVDGCLTPWIVIVIFSRHVVLNLIRSPKFTAAHTHLLKAHVVDKVVVRKVLVQVLAVGLVISRGLSGKCSLWKRTVLVNFWHLLITELFEALHILCFGCLLPGADLLQLILKCTKFFPVAIHLLFFDLPLDIL